MTGVESALPEAVVRAVEDVVSRRPLLVALDFDGVLAPIVERAPDARPLPGAADAVRSLARVPGVVVALVSGRARADLAAVSGLGRDGDGVLLVGSHGAEIDGSPPAGLDAAALSLLDEVMSGLRAIADEHPGAEVEVKPSAGVLHTRRVSRGEVQQTTDDALAAMGRLDRVHVTRGKEVVEVAVTEASKGAAVHALRQAHAAAAVVYLGDDVTDETVFATLGPDDLGIKVGDGDTRASRRIDDPAAVRTFLQLLLERWAHS